MNLEESIKIAVQGCKVELYDIVTTKENNNNIFRIYITSKDGITLDKCAEVSRMVSPILDLDEPINGKYNLEVSSVGVERKLKTLRHFIYSVGEKVKIKEYSTKTFKGELIEANKDGTLKIKNNKNIYTTKFDNILSASTYYEWEK
jgi:ribosome maturation factor RimP